MSNGVWVDVGLVNMHKQLLGTNRIPVPVRAALFTNNHTPVNGSVIGDFVIDGGTVEIIDPVTFWTYTLDAVAHQSHAQGVVNFDLALMGGNTYYGFVMFDSTATILYYAELFDVPFVVPGGGLNPLPLVVFDTRENCPP